MAKKGKLPPRLQKKPVVAGVAVSMPMEGAMPMKGKMPMKKMKAKMKKKAC